MRDAGDSLFARSRAKAEAELKRIVDEVQHRGRADHLLERLVQSDCMLHDLITVCACTGMRRGDVCKLHWGDVDFAEGVVTAKASKTGETVEVPIFRPLRDVLESRLDNGSEYVFPEAARILQENTDSLTWRFKKIIVKALSPDSDQETDVVCPVEIEPKGKAAIVKSIAPGARRDRILDSFKRLCYCEGASIREIVTATGRAHRTTAGDLAVVEKVTGARFVRRPARSVKHRGP